MIDYYVKYQASLFGAFSDIIPTSTALSKLLEIFSDKGLLTSIVQEIPNVTPSFQNRIRLSSPEGDLGILIGTSRIDIEKTLAKPKGENMGVIAAFAQEATDVFGRIQKVYPRQGNRLSLSSRCFCEALSVDRMNQIYLRLAKPSPYYQANPPFEWSIRAASVGEATINGVQEKLNVILTVARLNVHFQGPNVSDSFERIGIDTDLNTHAPNLQPRFSDASIGEFFGHALKAHEALIADITAHIA